MIRSIGSLSDQVVSHSEKKERGIKKSLSQQLKEERELLFGSPRKRFKKKILPESKKVKSQLIKFESSDECEGIFNLIISKYKQMSGEHIHLLHLQQPRTNHDRHVRMMVCYITFQVFMIRPIQIAEYFDIHRDILGTANHMLGRLFENQEGEREKFLELFDYFMTLMKREYQ